MTLADQIINHEPWNPDQLAQLNATGADLNALRDELLEGRRLRTAAEARERLHVYAVPWRNNGTHLIGIAHDCGWYHEEHDFTALGELVRRADQHGEDCRG